MARRDLLREPSSYASGELDFALRATGTQAEVVPTVSVDEALHGSRVSSKVSNRNVTRVLFISQNTALLNPSQQTLDGYINVADMFDEVHILVLRTGIPPRQPVMRPDTNVWIYTAAAMYWWQLPKAGRTMLAEQLMFASGFRPDLIVARDPLESGLIALRAAVTYGRTAQLHITHSSYSESDLLIGWIRGFIAWYTIPRFKSVRVTNKKIWNKIKSKVTTKDFAILPRLNPYESILTSTTAIDLHKQYPQYIFNLLFVGQLEEGSTVLEVLTAAAEMLQNSSISLIIIGDGPLRSDCTLRAKALGIEKQIIYLPSTVDVVPYLKAAHILFVTDTDELSEDIILQASYACVPMLLTETETRLDMFSHLESAYFCEPHKIENLSAGLVLLMNDVTLRQHMAEQALSEIQIHSHKDPQLYERRYRESIEAALFANDEKQVETVGTA
jgi:glycosyltransferase involved in cell wall biosynthesis